jgi:hypothetical protein
MRDRRYLFFTFAVLFLAAALLLIARIAYAANSYRVEISWDPTPRAARYKVWRTNGPSMPFAFQCDVPTTQTLTGSTRLYQVFPGLPSGRVYRFRVTAVTVWGVQGPPSAAAPVNCNPPRAPTGLIAWKTKE